MEDLVAAFATVGVTKDTHQLQSDARQNKIDKNKDGLNRSRRSLQEHEAKTQTKTLLEGIESAEPAVQNWVMGADPPDVQKTRREENREERLKTLRGLYPKGFDIMTRKWNWNGEGLGRANEGPTETLADEGKMPQGTGAGKRQTEAADGSEPYHYW